MKPAAVYIDGYNLYFGMLEAGMRPWLWVDLWRLAEQVTPDNDYYVEDVYYYTAPQRRPEGSKKRQGTWLEANVALHPELHVKQGFMEYRTKSCGTEHREEKQTDVNIAVDLLHHALEARYGAAILVSGDSDQVGAVERAQSAGCQIFGRFPPARHSNHLKDVITNNSFEIWKGRIKRSQLPNIVGSPTGYPLVRPAVEWGRRPDVEPQVVGLRDMAPKPNPDRDERFRIPVDDPIEGIRAMLKVDPDAEPVLTDEEVDELARVSDDDR